MTTAIIPVQAIWRDRAGRFSILRLSVFALAAGPALWIGWLAASGGLGPEPWKAATHQTGTWALRFLLLSLAVTPLRRIARWSRPIVVRRLLGLVTMAYAVAHLTLYVGYLNWDLTKVVSEITTRVYLMVGITGVLGLVALGATSFDTVIQRMGRWWGRLHKAVYGIAALGLLHHFMQSKVDVTEPVILSGLFLLLMGWRIAQARGFTLSAPLPLLGVAVLSALTTAVLESAWYGLATGVPWARVAQANLDFSYAISPAWWIFGVGMVPVLFTALRSAASLLPARREART
jgi:sulfoxide reductase heme-binding subunit YedZ